MTGWTFVSASRCVPPACATPNGGRCAAPSCQWLWMIGLLRRDAAGPGESLKMPLDSNTWWSKLVLLTVPVCLPVPRATLGGLCRCRAWPFWVSRWSLDGGGRSNERSTGGYGV